MSFMMILYHYITQWNILWHTWCSRLKLDWHDEKEWKLCNVLSSMFVSKFWLFEYFTQLYSKSSIWNISWRYFFKNVARSASITACVIMCRLILLISYDISIGVIIIADKNRKKSTQKLIFNLKYVMNLTWIKKVGYDSDSLLYDSDLWLLNINKCSMFFAVFKPFQIFFFWKIQNWFIQDVCKFARQYTWYMVFLFFKLNDIWSLWKFKQILSK
jgi:hypothetical protein